MQVFGNALLGIKRAFRVFRPTVRGGELLTAGGDCGELQNFRVQQVGNALHGRLESRATAWNTRSSLSMAFLAAILAAGCARKETSADIVILNGAEPESLDPAIITGQPDGRIGSALWEGLMRLDPQKGSPIPALAETWEISPDGKIYTFHMRTNAVW